MTENTCNTKPSVALIHPALGCTLGGSQIFVQELSQRLNHTCDVTVFSYSKVNDLCQPVFSICRGDLAKQKGVVITTLLKLLRKVAATPEIVIESLSSFLPVFLKLMRGHYDVIYPNNDWGGLLVASAVRALTGKPILFTEHSGFMDEGKIARRNLKFKPDKYVVLSTDMLEWVQTHYPDCNVEFIPNGVDLGKFSRHIPPAHIDLPRPIVLVVARHQPNKRLHLAIEAVAKLGKGSLLMLSSEENTEALQKLGEKRLGRERFRLMHAPYEQMPSYYNECDVFTLPSQLEPFGLVYIEAMACNKPVVAPNDISRAFIVGDAGVLCDVTDVDQYAQALEKALATDYGDKPRQQAQKFSWEVCAQHYHSAIESLLAAHRRK